MSIDEVDALLNKRSGLLGLAGGTTCATCTQLVDAGDAGATLALDVYLHRLRKYIGAYTAVLGRVDVIVFTAGVGENDDRVRARVLEGLECSASPWTRDRTRGRTRRRVISPDWTRTLVMVVPTNEELAIARQAVATIEAAGYDATSDESDPAPAATGHA